MNPCPLDRPCAQRNRITALSSSLVLTEWVLLHRNSGKKIATIKFELRTRDRNSTNCKHALAEGCVTNIKIRYGEMADNFLLNLVYNMTLSHTNMSHRIWIYLFKYISDVIINFYIFSFGLSIVCVTIPYTPAVPITSNECPLNVLYI